MPWMMFVFALLSFVVLCYAHSVALAVICIVLTIGFVIAGLLNIMAGRLNDASRDGGHIITPEELRLYREQAQARKLAADSANAANAAHAANAAASATPAAGSPPSAV